MIWVSIAAELIMVGIVMVSIYRIKKKGEWKEKKKFGLIQIVGSQLTAIFSVSAKKQEKNEVYQIACQLAGEEEGKRIFAGYRQKRLGLIFIAILLMNTMCLLQMLEPQKEEVMIENRQSRPEYGQGSRYQEVTVVLEGEETAEAVVSIEIPEKEISQEEARDKVEEGTAYIQNLWEGVKIKEDISLPAEWNGVTFYYESLSPQLMSSSGKWVGEIQERSQQIKLKVTAHMGEERKTDIITLFTATLEDMSAIEKLTLLLEKIEEGKYLTNNELILPDTTENGEQLLWMEKEESGKAAWILLGICLLLFALWQQDQKYKNMIKDRERRTKLSYPEFMNELVILVGAGLSLPAAWQRIGQDYQNKKSEGGDMDPLYEEIYRESREMEAGASMREVLEEFAVNVRFKEARRFAVLLTQNLKRGDAFLISRLKELNQEAWELRKKQVREKTEEADTKLLLPLMLMLVVILIIVLSPAMITMQA